MQVWRQDPSDDVLVEFADLGVNTVDWIRDMVGVQSNQTGAGSEQEAEAVGVQV